MAPVQFENTRMLGRLGVALAFGMLIGLERGWERRELPEGQRAAGLRTFDIIGLLGAVTIQLRTPMLLVAIGAALGLLAALGYWRESQRDQDISMTTAVVVVLLPFRLGALAGIGELTVAAATAVVITLLLGFKLELHGIVRRIERLELLGTLRLLLISVVILPVLPNRGFGPWDAFNPYRTWWMVVLVAGISYVGYFAIRILARRTRNRPVRRYGLFNWCHPRTQPPCAGSRGVARPHDLGDCRGNRIDVSAHPADRRRHHPGARYHARVADARGVGGRARDGGVVRPRRWRQASRR
jgi:hypothetical protein